MSQRQFKALFSQCSQASELFRHWCLHLPGLIPTQQPGGAPLTPVWSFHGYKRYSSLIHLVITMRLQFNYFYSVSIALICRSLSSSEDDCEESDGRYMSDGFTVSTITNRLIALPKPPQMGPTKGKICSVFRMKCRDGLNKNITLKFWTHKEENLQLHYFCYVCRCTGNALQKRLETVPSIL